MVNAFDLVAECLDALAEQGHNQDVRDALKTHEGRIRTFARNLVFAMQNTDLHYLVERRRRRYLTIRGYSSLRTEDLAIDAGVAKEMVDDAYRFCFGAFAKNPKPFRAPGQVDRCVIHKSCMNVADCPYRPPINKGAYPYTKNIVELPGFPGYRWVW